MNFRAPNGVLRAMLYTCIFPLPSVRTTCMINNLYYLYLTYSQLSTVCQEPMLDTLANIPYSFYAINHR